MVLLGVAFLVGFDGGSDARPPQPQPPPPGHVSWVISGDDLAALRIDNAGLARRFFDNSETFVVGSPHGEQNAVPRGYRSIPTLIYSSLREFERDVHMGAVDPRIAAVIYDPEGWARTPAREREAPVAAMHRFTRLAARWGYGPILAPGRDLALSGGGCAKRQGERLDQAYLRCGLTSGAVDAETFVVQAAPVELALDRLHALLRGARQQLDRQAPDVQVLASLSTEPPGVEGGVWPVDLVRAARLELKHFPGIMLNFPASDTDLAASFLRDLEREGPVDGRLVSRRD
ncbi:MAG TPA: hypothetical protein VNN15_06060 [Solirubrobacterales bacterium]|nr:hypothetical protein [Solirubrobacterales bacterium]